MQKTIQNPLVLFDGVCNLCNGTVNFILKRDKQKQFRFVALQSEAGMKIKQKLKIPNDVDSVVLIYNGKVFYESDAALKIVRLLPAPWKWLAAFQIIPQNLRNTVYRRIARNRYHWFGKKNVCRIPTASEREFFPGKNELHL
ncbi:Predicted thiol-disulfide oxidoreductase YuxK, DCC family [Mariniphaga anaerophila]|uniref:Predicted thiol-disulfide oxidoreductase YuxK, DCC family n=1 Tax=Mariniphaga anaerophila TaxID=1484053 RepID=A0A1M5F6W4_9BACT|nr:thiol-disulfide oxidoreductase DCC family protein [Mariniphaga anaerophila]SHF86802.1 Predicted thiol-disulfide oxidoreductase YuxK, DCC family [Mariniphaga anaerophila]